VSDNMSECSTASSCSVASNHVVEKYMNMCKNREIKNRHNVRLCDYQRKISHKTIEKHELDSRNLKTQMFYVLIRYYLLVLYFILSVSQHHLDIPVIDVLNAKFRGIVMPFVTDMRLAVHTFINT